MLLVGKRRMTAAALQDFSVRAMKLTLADAREQSDRGTIEFPSQAPVPERNARILRAVATEVLDAYDIFGPRDITHCWVLGAGLQEAAVMASGEPVADPVVIRIMHRYLVRFTMEVLFAARPGNEAMIARAFEPLLSWDRPVPWW